jgi:hypothetical protein
VIKYVLLLGCVALALIAPATASAHSVQPAAATVVRNVGPYRLAAEMSAPATLPGTILVQIAAQQSFSGLVAITPSLTPANAPPLTPQRAYVISSSATVVAEFPVIDAGAYELALQAAGQDGVGEARIPMTVVQQPFAWIAAVIPAALGAFGVIAVGAMIARLRRSISPRVDLLLTSSMAISALVALMAFVAAQFIPASVTLSLATSTP